MQANENFEAEILEGADVDPIFPRPGLLTQDTPTLMGILTLGNIYYIMIDNYLSL